MAKKQKHLTKKERKKLNAYNRIDRDGMYSKLVGAYIYHGYQLFNDYKNDYWTYTKCYYNPLGDLEYTFIGKMVKI